MQALPVYYCKGGVGGDNAVGVIGLISKGGVSGSSYGYPGGDDSELKTEEAIRQAPSHAVDIILYSKNDTDAALFTSTGINDAQSGSWDLVNINNCMSNNLTYFFLNLK